MRLSIKVFLASISLSLSCIACLSALADDVAIYGDSQHNPDVQRRLVQTILSFKPSIVFRVGDMVGKGNEPEAWKAFNDINAPLLKTTEYFPVLANHERSSPLYFENFRFLRNRRWYSVDRAGSHFIVLDSTSRVDRKSEQYTWLEADLADVRDRAKYIVVIIHRPLFDLCRRDTKHKIDLQRILFPLFERYGVSAVFSGHVHNYQRFENNGIYFIVTGGGGANLETGSDGTDSHAQKFIVAHHFCLLTLEGDSLRVRAIDINSNIIDDFTLAAGVKKRSALSVVPELSKGR